MKNSIFICTASLCCCLIVCALVRMIAPTGSTSKIMSVVISVFTLCCLFSPVADLVKNFDVSAYEYEGDVISDDLSKEYDENVILHTTRYISEYVSTLLTSAGIEVTQVKTEVTTDEKRGIYVSGVYIYLYEASEKQKKDIENLISSELGVKPEILESKYGERE